MEIILYLDIGFFSMIGVEMFLHLLYDKKNHGDEHKFWVSTDGKTVGRIKILFSNINSDQFFTVCANFNKDLNRKKQVYEPLRPANQM
jgi:hypothetical protein